MTARLAALLIGVSTLAAIALASIRARADESAADDASASIIAILCAPGDGLGRRIVAELEALGFQTAMLGPSAEPASRASLEASARRAGATAAIDVASSERGVEVWIADRTTGKTVLRVLPNDGGTPDRDAALALRVVELLRASLLEAPIPAAPRDEHPYIYLIRASRPVPAPIEPAERPAPVLRFSLAPGVLVSAGGLGASTSLTLGVEWMPSDRIGLIGLASIPITRAWIERTQGTAELAVLFAGAAARFGFAVRESQWSPSLDLGVVVLSLRSIGTANPGYVASTPSAVSAAPFARLGLATALTPMFRLRADVFAGAVPQGMTIDFSGERVATWGQPFVLFSAGVDFGWF